jgi:hypothetical protein
VITRLVRGFPVTERRSSHLPSHRRRVPRVLASPPAVDPFTEGRTSERCIGGFISRNAPVVFPADALQVLRRHPDIDAHLPPWLDAPVTRFTGVRWGLSLH